MYLEQEIPHPIDEIQRIAFIELLGRFDSDECYQIMTAYDLAEKTHSQQKRASGEKYFAHPRHVALFLTSLGIDDPDIISGALLHDVVEDAHLINGESFMNNADWMKRADEWLTQEKINPRVRRIVANLTKPRIDGFDVFNEDQRRNSAIETLKQSEPEVILIKMADRLHNLQTLGGLDRWKAEMAISETQGVMFGVFSKILQTAYRKKGIKLFKGMTEAICEYERIQNR